MSPRGPDARLVSCQRASPGRAPRGGTNRKSASLNAGWSV
jgi:hypothetical protein